MAGAEIGIRGPLQPNRLPISPEGSGRPSGTSSSRVVRRPARGDTEATTKALAYAIASFVRDSVGEGAAGSETRRRTTRVEVRRLRRLRGAAQDHRQAVCPGEIPCGFWPYPTPRATFAACSRNPRPTISNQALRLAVFPGRPAYAAFLRSPFVRVSVRRFRTRPGLRTSAFDDLAVDRAETIRTNDAAPVPEGGRDILRTLMMKRTGSPSPRSFRGSWYPGRAVGCPSLA
jgi:hypothetical protein